MLQLIKDDMQDYRSLESIRVEVLIGTNYKACVSLCAWMSDFVSIILFSGTLACSRVAKVSVCPQALRALREQSLAFSHEKRQALHQKAAWPTNDQDQVFPFVFFHIFALLSASTVSTTKVRCNPGLHLSSAHLLTRICCTLGQRTPCDRTQCVLIFFPFCRAVPLKTH